ncbi:AEC family transporter [Rhodobacteraceae bacterium LMO-12]|nr:AEC family transporter [Rhodobacteraceae bacterium LMO-JJ12]
MLAILSITFPIYAAVALGYFMVRKGVFRPEQMPVFGGYVMNVALPALLFNAVASRDVGEVFNLAYMAVFLAGALGTIVVAWVWFSAMGVSPSRRAVAIMGTTCPNSGYVGYPVMLLIFPAFAGQILALNMLVENFVIIPLCLALMEAANGSDEARVLRKIGRILLSVLRRPMVIGLLAGLLVSLSGIAMPEPATRLFSMLAASASALALFVIGGSLVGVAFRGIRAIAVQIVLGKLILHPAMVALAVIVVPIVGFAPLSNEMRLAVVISAAMPMFSIYALFAHESGYEGMASIAQILATAGGFFTLNALLLILH